MGDEHQDNLIWTRVQRIETVLVILASVTAIILFFLNPTVSNTIGNALLVILPVLGTIGRTALLVIVLLLMGFLCGITFFGGITGLEFLYKWSGESPRRRKVAVGALGGVFAIIITLLALYVDPSISDALAGLLSLVLPILGTTARTTLLVVVLLFIGLLGGLAFFGGIAGFLVFCEKLSDLVERKSRGKN